MRPSRLVRFYLAVPQDYEDVVGHELGKLRSVELISRSIETGRREELEMYIRFLRLADRVKVAINSVEDLIIVKEKKSFLERLKGVFSESPRHEQFSGILSKDEIAKLVEEIESKLTSYTAIIDENQKKITYLKELEVKIELFKKNDIPLDILGEYTHIFVKAGLLPIQNLSLLKDYLKPYNVILTVKEGIRKDYLLIIAASQIDKEEILKILAMLNFAEIEIPKEYRGSPDEILKIIAKEKEDAMKNLKQVYDKLLKLNKTVVYYKRYIRFLQNVKSSVTRTRNLTIFDGWIEKDKYEELVDNITKITNGKLYIEYEEPGPGYPIKPPTKLKNPIGFRGFEILTRIRGVPDYNEIDPTPIFSILFLIMYGMMFGDIGEGLALFILGLIFYKIRKPMLGMSRNALNNIGYVLMMSSISAMIFGFLYGEAFLVHFMEPIWLNPIESTIDIAIISIEFGIAQLILALILNIIISLSNKEYIEAFISWKGLLGLLYLSVGVYLAIEFIISGMTISVFTRSDVLPFTIIEIISLVFVYLKPTIENIVHHEGKKITETLIEGLGEFIETFISFLTNSVSYIRLGAFAIAHGALAEAALVFGGIIGIIPSYLLFNVLVTTLDGFAAGIQSLRLLFYEFSTKFYRDEGKLFKPLRI